jgi:hypothetical protein
MGEINVMLMRWEDGKISFAFSDMLCKSNDSFAPRLIKFSVCVHRFSRRPVYGFFRVVLVHIPHLFKPLTADPAP